MHDRGSYDGGFDDGENAQGLGGGSAFSADPVQPAAHPLHQLVQRLAAVRSCRGVTDPGGHGGGFGRAHLVEAAAAPAPEVPAGERRFGAGGQTERGGGLPAPLRRAAQDQTGPGHGGGRRPRGPLPGPVQRGVTVEAGLPERRVHRR